MKSIAICALLTPVIAGGGLALWPQAATPASTMPSPSISQAAVVALTAAATMQPEPAKSGKATASQPQNMDLHTALERGQLAAEFRGNGRDALRAILVNRTAA